MSSPITILIAGCGYVGQALARAAQAQGFAVMGITRSVDSAAALSNGGIPCTAADLSEVSSLALVAQQLAGRDVRIVHCAAGGKGGGPDAYRKVYLEGLQHLLMAFPAASRVLFTSSSSVYPQIDGSVVTETSAAAPERGTGLVLRETENITRNACGCVLRLAGIYGPGRSVLLRNFLDGTSTVDVRTEAPATPDGRWVNQIHRDDAAAAMLHLLTSLPGSAFHGALFNAADSCPMLQRTLYTALSERFALPMPPDALPDFGRKRGWTNKRVSNAALLAAGWSPRFPSWLDALDYYGTALAAVRDSN